MNHELSDIQAGFKKGRGTRAQIANIRWIIKRAREFQKNIYFCFIDYAKAFDCVITTNWKILQEMGILDHLTSPLRNQYAGQKATVRIEHEWTGPKWERNTSRMYLGVKYIKGCHPSCLTSMQSTSCKILGWMKHKLELRLPGEISITSDTHCDTTLMAQCEEELKSLFRRVKEE